MQVTSQPPFSSLSEGAVLFFFPDGYFLTTWFLEASGVFSCLVLLLCMTLLPSETLKLQHSANPLQTAEQGLCIF